MCYLIKYFGYLNINSFVLFNWFDFLNYLGQFGQNTWDAMVRSNEKIKEEIKGGGKKLNLVAKFLMLKHCVMVVLSKWDLWWMDYNYYRVIEEKYFYWDPWSFNDNTAFFTLSFYVFKRINIKRVLSMNRIN